MYRLVAIFAMAGLAGAIAWPAAVQAATHRTVMSVKILNGTGPKTMDAKHRSITFHVLAGGIRLDPAHVGKKAAVGHGHIQVYLDRIPSTAYAKGSLTGELALSGTSKFTTSFTAAWIKANRGHHKFLVALAQNNNVLYRSIRPATFAVTVK